MKLVKISEPDNRNKENVKGINYCGSLEGMRTELAEGHCIQKPEVGKSFSFQASPINEGYTTRCITTSHVTDVNTLDDGTIEFQTESGSRYQLRVD